MSGEQRANLVKQCLELVHTTGIEIVSLTFDGCPANVTIAKQLGCLLDIGEMTTSFDHPISKQPVYVFFDACHMLKLVRNAFESIGVFKDCRGRTIEWSHLQNLNKLQEKEHLHLANKIRHSHIFFLNQKMKVKLASQLFSNSVADGLKFCTGLDNNCDFQDVEGN